ncbi:MAG: Large extracellular alpha-helical protein [Parcubacteria group bacterium GW2011_GWF2_50_9]|nr:MAG: Large extracellular alpha-helical protein [Parcubacteria group bacterium GW2011_GWF2_50_9]OHA19853.1 MAG: hypothetical protein A2759_04345 [Candidatus Taylorbacteria bacterium RIFCSPHIGHO2_01_FULL_49_60]
MDETQKETSKQSAPQAESNVAPPFLGEPFRPFSKGGTEAAPWFLRRDFKIGIGVLLALCIAATLIFLMTPAKRMAPKSAVEETYTLVRDKVSKSAAVALALPKEMSLTPAEANEKVTFEPAIEGEWVAGGSRGQLLFEPKEQLKEGAYYTVSLKIPDGVLSKDFLVDEDPKVLSIFPRENSEAPETSDITIVFNRPMVPITTLDALQESDVPIEITPPTKGKFKWISTRNLQFIPEKRLVRSARYTVKIKDGFVSMDGLPIQGITHAFTTRPLRYADTYPNTHGAWGDTSGGTPSILYNQPLIIRFNQPVDLERTKQELEVKAGNGQATPFIAEYGTRTLYENGKEKEYIDTSALAIYGAKDRNGRERFWDFASSYSIALRKAIPQEGDIILDEGISYNFSVPEVIAEITTESKRSRHVAQDLFDPLGKLIIRFYEDIDKGASDIVAPHLRSIEYGERCKKDSDGNTPLDRTACEKEPDKTLIVLTFEPDAFVNGEEIPVTFKRIVNTEGVSLIVEPLLRAVTVFPKLALLRTLPEAGAKGAKLTELKICSNTPLKMPAEKDFYTKTAKSNLSIGKWNWYESWRVGTTEPGSPCRLGEFETTLRYGLIPESAYAISLQVEDDFGQVAAKELAFESGALAEMHRRFSHLQKAYNVTTPSRTKLVYGVENLEYVNLHICKTDAPTMLRYLGYETRPQATLPGENLSCIQTWTKRIELPRRYFTLNFFELDLREYVPSPLGHYVLTFSHPDYRRTVYDYRIRKNTHGERLYERSFLTVTNLAVQEKKVENSEYVVDEYPPLTKKVQEESKGNLYLVTGLETLAPVSGAAINLYRKNGAWVSGGTTDAEGIARAPVAPMATGAIVFAGEDSAIVSSETDKFQWAQSLASAQKTYIYTDRPIYRPSEDVFLKGLYRIGYDGNYEILNNRPASVQIYDSRGEKVSTNEAVVSKNGTFTSSFALPKGAPLGMYRVEALGGRGYFEVEEYKPAAFKIDVASKKEEYIAGETFELDVDAAYYFGVPLERGDNVEYSILAQDYYFDRYSDRYFEFGKGWYYGEYGGFGDRFLSRGRTALDEKGKATIALALDFATLFKKTGNAETGTDRSKIVTVNVTVKNKQGQSVSARKSFIVHRGEFYLGSNLLRRYFGKGEENKILIKSVDTNGKERAVEDITAVVYKVAWESYKRQEVDGRFYYRSERKKKLVKTQSMRTNASGDDTAPLSLAEPGEYELQVSASDRKGNRVVSSFDFYVYGTGFVSVRESNNETLELAVDRKDLKVGETANIVIKSPFERGKALLTIERGRIFQYKIIDVNQNLVNVSVPIEEQYLPNVFVSVLLLSPKPEVKYGQVEFRVSKAEKELAISVRSDKKSYLPGEKVRLFVETKDSYGRPVPAEISIAVADMSVLALKGNPKKDPALFFYGGFPLGVGTASNIKNILHEAEVPAGTKGGGGGDGELARKKRGDFRSTALWQGVLLTDAQGKADIAFTLPDNLTTWQSEAVGITSDTKVGAGYSELVAQKKVMVTPLHPRFIVAGDTFKIGAKVFNQSADAIRFNVKIESKTLSLPGAKNAFLKIGPGESTAAYFDAKAPETIEKGKHVFTLSAEGGGLLDVVEEGIAIKKNDTYESTATSFSTSKERAREYVFLPENIVPEKGALTISANATLAMYLEGALNFLISFPYGCSEQLGSKLSAIALTKRAYAAKGKLAVFESAKIEFEGQSYTPSDLIEIGLARIYASQTSNGGFAYYPRMPSNLYLSIHLLGALLDIRSAGFNVKPEVLESVSRFIGQKALYDNYYRTDWDTSLLAAYALERVAQSGGMQNPLRGRVLQIAGTKKFVRENASNLSLGHLALILSNPGYDAFLRDEILASLENRLTIDGRGAFIQGGTRRTIYDFYETPIKDTALLLRAWTKAGKNHELADKVLRWLLKSRSKDGSWGSTNNTLSAIEALTEYLEWKKESDSNFELSIYTDDALRETFSFNRETNEKTFTTTIPVKDISKGEMHTIDFVKKNLGDLANTFYYDLSLTYFLPIDAVPQRDEGFTIERSLYRLDDEARLTPLQEANAGEVLRGVLRVTVPKERRFVAVEDFIPAGMELINFKLSTEDQSLQEGAAPLRSGKRAGENGGKRLMAALGLGGLDALPDTAYSKALAPREKLYADAEELRDDRLFLFRENLPSGVYEYEYFVRALIPGTFHHLPAVVSEMYFPENFGRTKGDYFTVAQ